MTTARTEELDRALTRLVELAESSGFALPSPARDGRLATRDGVVASVREHLLPRLRDLDAPALVVLVGSTGAGKSTLLNTLAGAPVTTSGAVRPTTREPVVWTHRRHRHRYGADLLPGFADGVRSLRVVAHDDDRFGDVTVVDTPDLDSVVTAHRELADEVLAAADLGVWVTTAQRYADAVPREVLRGASERGIPLLVVLNRVPAGAAAAVTTDLREQLADAGIGPGAVELVTVAETVDLVDGRLPADGVTGLADAVAALGDADRRAGVVDRALRASLAHVDRTVRELADAVEAEQDEATALRDAAVAAYARQEQTLLDALEDGRLIHAEVLDRWQAFVGTGEMLRALSAGASRVRDWLRRVWGGGAEGPRTVRTEVRSTLAATLARHADRAAADTAEAWELSPVGGTLLADQRGRLWRADPATADRASQLMDRWQDQLTALVAEHGEGRRRLAQVASLGVNGTAAVLMLAVFAQTGGLTGAEVGITAGAAAVQQRLLEHVFGTAAARQLVAEARQSLAVGIDEVLARDRQRYDDVLDEHLPPPTRAGALRAAADVVREAADDVLAGRRDA